MRLFSLILIAYSLIGREKLTPRFEEHVAGRDYRAHLPGATLRLSPSRIELDTVSGPIRINFGGKGELEAEQRLPGVTNYLTSAQVRPGIRSYARLRQREIFSGIDAVFYWSEGQLEYDLILAPGTDPAAISFQIESPAKPTISPSGDLMLNAHFRWRKPVLYQNGKIVEGEYTLEGNRAGFRVGPYNRNAQLVIDPTLAYSTYIGGFGNECIRAVLPDASGNVFIAGVTTSQNLNVTRPLQAAYAGHTATLLAGDAFIAKFDAAGALIFLTYLGGSADDFAAALALDPSGNLWVAGGTSSANFPVTANAYQRTYAGTGGSDLFRVGDGFLARLSPGGETLQYSTYYGGRADDVISAMAVDAAGNIHVTGATISPNLPITANAAQNAMRGGGGEQVFPRYGVVPFNAGDAFYAKFNPSGTALIYATYLGGSLDDFAVSVALDSAGSAYIAGYTLSFDFPTTQGAYQRRFAGSDLRNNIFWNFGDGFVAKINSSGAIAYATLIGGNCDDFIQAIQADSAGNAWIAGSTCSQDFPTTANGYQRTMRGPYSAPIADQLYGDAFIAGINPTGTALVYSTFFGGTEDDAITAMTMDASGLIYATGATNSRNFPLTADAQQSRFGGGGIMNQNQDLGDIFLIQFDPKSSALKYSTYLGGSFDDVGAAIAIDASGNVYIGGGTVSGNFPTTPGALQTQIRGTGSAGRYRGDAVFSKFSGFTTSPAPTFTAVQNAASYVSGSVSPGLIVVGYGSFIGPAQLAGAALDAAGRLSGTVAETQFLFDGVAAPIIYASATQSSMIVPYEVAGKSATQIVAVYKGQRSAPLTVPVVSTQPGLFSANFSGSGQGAIYNQDNRPNSPSNPARRGDIVILYGTGEGQTSPAGITGLIANSVYPKPIGGVSVSVGGVEAEVLYAGAVPGVVGGEFQINIRVPINLSAGNPAVVVRIGSAQSQANLTVSLI